MILLGSKAGSLGGSGAGAGAGAALAASFLGSGFLGGMLPWGLWWRWHLGRNQEMQRLGNEIGDWATSLPFYPGQEPPQKGWVRARAAATDYKRKKYQQGTADNCVLSPGLGLPAPSPSPHSSHPSWLPPLEQADPFLPIGGNPEGLGKQAPSKMPAASQRDELT